MIHDGGISFMFWSCAIDTAAYLINISATSENESGLQTLYELWCGNPPELSNLRVSGYFWFIHVHSELRSKRDTMAAKGISLRYDSQSACFSMAS